MAGLKSLIPIPQKYKKAPKPYPVMGLSDHLNEAKISFSGVF
jgi:hypothetical protein